mgnify:CR=1 FL=1|jgi:iron complex transport system substrate-binding protein
MSFLNAAINKVGDEFLREQLQDRVDIVEHKIKFMDKVPVAVLDSDNLQNTILNHILETAGGFTERDLKRARVIIYQDQHTSMLAMMGVVPALLEKEWPAVEYNRLYLMDELRGDQDDPEFLVALLEDVAEILYPGYFVFGNEGQRWMSFGV